MRAGDPEVGMDIVTADSERDKDMLAIANDGAEFLSYPDGEHADPERRSGTVTMYLMKIRAGLVRPYTSIAALFVEEDRRAAVLQAARRGYY